MNPPLEPGVRRVAVVVNPTKFEDLAAVQETLTRLCVEAGWAEPLFLETTADDPGVGQAEEAIAQGVDVVCPLGGDGTVRAVASALVAGDTVLGLLPGGTGNLLARNLGLPVDSLEDAMRVVLTGSERRIDVGLVRLLPDSPSPDVLKGTEEDHDDPRREDEEVFLVMAGLGLDAEVMASTSEKIKGIVGWPAYVLAGVGKLFGRGFRVRVTAGAESLTHHARTVIVGNCGTLQGDLELMPDAQLDDGILDAVVMAPRGPGGWAAVVVDLTSRHRRGHPRVIRLKGPRMSVVARERTEAQIDGDPMGEQFGFTTRVLPGALTVRVTEGAVTDGAGTDGAGTDGAGIDGAGTDGSGTDG